MKQQKNSRKKRRQRRSSRPAVFVPLALVCIAALVCGYLLEGSELANLHGTAETEVPLLRFNEIQSSNMNTIVLPNGEAPDWFEIENAGETPVSLKGISIAMDIEVSKIYSLPAVTVAPGETLLIYADGRYIADAGKQLHAPFRLAASGGSRLYMFDQKNNVLDSVTLPEMDQDFSYCRVDGESWEMSAMPTPGQPNRVTDRREAALAFGTGAVELSEVMSSNSSYYPDENGEYHDYVELRNCTGGTVNLAGYFLSDDTTEPRKWEFPDVTLAAGEYITVYCSGYDRADDPAHLHTGFRLSGEGETLCLTDPEGTTVSMVALPLLERGQAYSNINGAWTVFHAPTPNLPNDHASASRLDAEQRSARGTVVMISEIMAAPENEPYDWVELYNAGSAPVDLSGYGLSAELNHPREWQLPAGTSIAPQSSLIVFFTGSDRASREAAGSGYICTSKSIPAGGGYTMTLASADGNILDTMYVPQQLPGISYGRSAAGECGYLGKGSFQAPNGSECYTGMAGGAEYSVRGGLFTKGDSFGVELRAEPGARIYYTLDCTDPSEASSLYTGTPIPVSSTTILRTRVYKDGSLPSFMDTQSYLFDVNAAGDASYVISLVSDPDGLFGYQNGIMVKGPNAWDEFPYGAYGEGANYWMDWEREAHIEFYTGATGDQAISQECGIKMHGRNTRAYELKAFKVLARAGYGDPTFSYPVFSDRPYDEYEGFVLRYSGQDYKYTFMRDVVSTSLAANTPVMYQEAEECIVYLNGEYYSAMYVREHVSPFSICRHEGWEGREGEIDLVKGSAEVMRGDNDDFAALEDWLKSHDCSTQEAYEMIDSKIDIDNFIDYIIMEMVFAMPDTANVKRYRDPEGDGKWRWVIYDLDRAYRLDEDPFKVLGTGNYQTLFKACMKNPTIRDRFLKRLDEALSTWLSADYVTNEALAQFERIKPLLPDYLDVVDVSSRNYESLFETYLRMIERRPMQMVKYCKAYFDLSDSEVKIIFANTLEVDAAFVSPLDKD